MQVSLIKCKGVILLFAFFFSAYSTLLGLFETQVLW